MQKRGFVIGRPQHHEGVVVDRHVPVERVGEALHARRNRRGTSGRDRSDGRLDRSARRRRTAWGRRATRDRSRAGRRGHSGRAGTSARPSAPAVDELASLAQCPVAAMIEANAHRTPAHARTPHQRLDFNGEARRRLFHQNMAAALDRSGRDLGQRMMQGSLPRRCRTASPSASPPVGRTLRRPARCWRAQLHVATSGSAQATSCPPGMARARACGRSVRSRRSQPAAAAHSFVAPAEATIAAGDAAQRVGIALGNSGRCSGQAAQLSQTALISLPLMPLLAVEARNTASSAPKVERNAAILLLPQRSREKVRSDLVRASSKDFVEQPCVERARRDGVDIDA